MNDTYSEYMKKTSLLIAARLKQLGFSLEETLAITSIPQSEDEVTELMDYLMHKDTFTIKEIINIAMSIKDNQNKILNK